MKKKIIESLNATFEIMVELIKSERSLQVQFSISLLLLLLSLVFNFSRIDTMILTIIITVNIAVQLVVVSIKKIVDRVYANNEKMADIIKTMVSGSTFVMICGSIFIGYLLFFNNLAFNPYATIDKIRGRETHLVFLSLAVSIIVAVFLKTKTNTGRPFQGGYASGHSAIAFSIATVITIINEKILTGLLAYMLAFLVAESRVENKIHTIRETVVGGILGTVVTIFMFKILG